MANRMFSRDAATLEKGVVTLFAEVSIGAAGAPTLNPGRSKGIKSIVHNGGGSYTVTLQDRYQRVLGVQCSFISEDSATPAIAPNVTIALRAPDSLTVLCSSGTTLTDPGEGETMLLRIDLSNSTAL